MARRRRHHHEPEPEATDSGAPIRPEDRLDPRAVLMAPPGLDGAALLTWARETVPHLLVSEDVAQLRAQHRADLDGWHELTVEEKRAAIRAARRAGETLRAMPARRYWGRSSTRADVERALAPTLARLNALEAAVARLHAQADDALAVEPEAVELALAA